MSEIKSPHSLIQLERLAAEAQAYFFLDEETADWKSVREEYGEKLQATRLLRMMSEGQPHDLVWLWRRGVDNDTGKPYEFCQAVCKCVTKANDPSDMTPMLECGVWQQGVVTRASEVREEGNYMPLGQMLEVYRGLDATDIRIGAAENIHQMTEGIYIGNMQLDDFAEAILFYMNIDKKRPFYWAGNAYSGGFQVGPMAILTGREAPEVVDKAYELHEKGWIHFDGRQTIALPA